MLKLKDVVSISGKSGLHKIVGKRNNGLIVETLDESKRRFPSSLTQKVSILEDIAVFTNDADVKLAEVMRSIHQKVKGGFKVISKNSTGDQARAFFKEVLPDYDEDRVYVSDILKIANWYGLLKDLVDFDAAPETEPVEESSKELLEEKKDIKAKIVKPKLEKAAKASSGPKKKISNPTAAKRKG
jgi:hypothetical protein